MNYQTNGKFETLVVLGEENKGLFDVIVNYGVDKLHAELEASYMLPGVYSNVSVELDEMFDAGMDDWHASIKISADVKATVSAKSKEQALSVMQNYYADSFNNEILYLFAGNGDMIQVDSMVVDTNIQWHNSVAHAGKVDEYFLIYAANHNS